MANNGGTDSVARALALSALDGTMTSSTITIGQDIGGYSAGDIIPSGSNVNEILAILLTGNVPATDVTVYYGATTNVPTDLTGLTSKVVSSKKLFSGYGQKIIAGDSTTLTGQYPCFAVPTSYTLEKWCTADSQYNIPYSLVSKDGYNIYYLNTPSYDCDDGGITYLITVVAVA